KFSFYFPCVVFPLINTLLIFMAEDATVNIPRLMCSVFIVEPCVFVQLPSEHLSFNFGIAILSLMSTKYFFVVATNALTCKLIELFDHL
ncbi:hypothetical protein BDQ17DRAFT_1370426, partial [Cyathus striatus]